MSVWLLAAILTAAPEESSCFFLEVVGGDEGARSELYWALADAAPVCSRDRGEPPPEASPAVEKELDALEQAIYRDDIPEAVRLDTKIARRAPLGINQVIRRALLRASLALLEDDEERARVAIRAALGWDPALTIDLNVYRPSLAGIAEEERAMVMARPLLRVVTRPVAAMTRINNTVGSEVRLARGPVQVQVSAAGYRSRRMEFEHREDRTLVVELEPLPPAANAEPRVRLRPQGDSVELVAQAAAMGTRRGRASAEPSLIALEIERLLRPIPKPPVWTLNIEAFPAWRSRTASGDSLELRERTFGAGARVTGTWRSSRLFFAQASGDYRSHSGTELALQRGDATAQSVDGGSRIHLVAAAGISNTFLGWSWSTGIATHWQSYSPQPLENGPDLLSEFSQISGALEGRLEGTIIDRWDFGALRWGVHGYWAPLNRHHDKRTADAVRRGVELNLGGRAWLALGGTTAVVLGCTVDFLELEAARYETLGSAELNDSMFNGAATIGIRFEFPR